MWLRTKLLQSWQQPNILTCLLIPISWLYRGVFSLRKFIYSIGLLPSYRAPIPVVVVGNITVGGTGKTPLVIRLVELLRDNGFNPGVISRGYSGQSSNYPLSVTQRTSVAESGDEPALIVRRTGVPMMVGPNRGDAIKQLIRDHQVDIIISDDGLQHLAMQRDVEICLVDDTNKSSNTHLLPAGSYREPLSRLNSVDLVLLHMPVLVDVQMTMALASSQPQPVRPSSDHVPDGVDWLSQSNIHAVAGIGNPNRFFETCRELGFKITEHAFADHHSFTAQDLNFSDDDLVLMTEKDAVKCLNFANEKHWYLPVDAKLSNEFETRLLELLKTVSL